MIPLSTNGMYGREVINSLISLSPQVRNSTDTNNEKLLQPFDPLDTHEVTNSLDTNDEKLMQPFDPLDTHEVTNSLDTNDEKRVQPSGDIR